MITKVVARTRHFWVFAGFLMMSACGQNAVDISVEFENTQDVQEGSTVYFKEQAVGEVLDVANKGAGSVLQVAINPEAATLISSDATMVLNRIKPGAPLEIHNPAGQIEQGLQSGQHLVGVDSMLELMAWSLGDAISEGGKEITAMISGFQDYLKSDDFQDTKEEFQQQMREAGRTAGKALKSIERDLSDAIQQMAASEDQMAQAMDELGTELSPMMEEIARTGTELSIQLEQFLQSLEQAAPEQRESGQQFMLSMTRLLEQLNEGLEKGAERAIQENSSTPESQTN